MCFLHVLQAYVVCEQTFSRGRKEKAGEEKAERTPTQFAPWPINSQTVVTETPSSRRQTLLARICSRAKIVGSHRLRLLLLSKTHSSLQLLSIFFFL